MAARFSLGDNLPQLVERTYQQACSLSKVIFTPSAEVAVIRTSTGLPFQLRFCPSLAKKPTAHDHHNDSHNKEPKKRFNPFENPDSDMIIAQLPPNKPTHTLVLNKFPIIAEHFMVITKSVKEQTHKLEQDDLEAVYACLNAWRGKTSEGQERRLFAFFNSGPYSGASQPHRHVQFLPIETMEQGMDDSQEWMLLIDMDGFETRSQALCLQSRIQETASGEELYSAYLDLYEQATQAVESYIQSTPGQLALHDTSTGSSSFSYNLGMTKSKMVLIPRKSEGLKLRDEKGTELGFACLNGTVLGGSLMVKKAEEFAYLKAEASVMDRVLEEIGIPQGVDKASDVPKI